jgi:SAM-dependent methyltransferase
MVNISNKASYVAEYDRHLKTLSEEDAVKRHVGGIDSYYVIGAVERRLLEISGLKPDSYVINLGCGGGRLEKALSDKPELRLLGIDVVPRLIDYCRRELRKDWRFEISEDFTIPERDNAADFVTAFSLFTHLLHEETFTYLRDAHRVLKPGGTLMFSFLEYRIPAHRKTFLNSEKTRKLDRQLIMFSDRDCFQFFASELGFEAPRFFDGTHPFIGFETPQRLPDGKIVEGTKAFGQSLCLMQKPRSADRR